MTLFLLGVVFDFKMTFEKHLHSSFSKAWYLVKTLASIPWQITSCEMLSGFCPLRFGVLFCSVVLGCWDTPHTSGPCSQWCHAVTYLVVWFSVTLHIVDLWQHYACCTRSGVTRCILFMVLYLCCMCRCVTSQHRNTFIRFSISVEWSILVIPCSMVWDWRVPRAGPMPFYQPSSPHPYCHPLFSLKKVMSSYLV